MGREYGEDRVEEATAQARNWIEMVCNGEARAMEAEVEDCGASVDFDENLLYVFTFPDGVVVEGDAGSNGQGQVIRVRLR